MADYFGLAARSEAAGTVDTLPNGRTEVREIRDEALSLSKDCAGPPAGDEMIHDDYADRVLREALASTHGLDAEKTAAAVIMSDVPSPPEPRPEARRWAFGGPFQSHP